MATFAVVLGLSLLALVLFRPARHDRGGGRVAASRLPEPMASPDTKVEVEADDERTEACLVARLLAGDLPASGYRCAMEVLAARDAARRPIVVPPDGSH